jgi:hypothetical protein
MLSVTGLHSIELQNDTKIYLTGIRCELYSSGSGQGPVARCCEYGNEPSGSLSKLLTRTEDLCSKAVVS